MTTCAVTQNAAPLLCGGRSAAHRHVRRLLRGLVEHLGGYAAAADTLGVSKWSLYQHTDHNITRPTPWVLAHNLQAAAGAWPVLDWQNDRAGLAVVPLPSPAATRDDLLGLYAEASAEVGDVARVLQAAVADGRVDDEELEACEGELREALGALATLRAAVRARAGEAA